jgi:hypothetical protein
MSGEPQSPLKKSKERILLIKEKARRARNNDRFGEDLIVVSESGHVRPANALQTNVGPLRYGEQNAEDGDRI